MNILKKKLNSGIIYLYYIVYTSTRENRAYRFNGHMYIYVFMQICIVGLTEEYNEQKTNMKNCFKNSLINFYEINQCFYFNFFLKGNLRLISVKFGNTHN